MNNKIINKYKNMSLPVKAALWYTICNFLNKGIALLTTPIFTRILTEEQFGTFSIFQSWFNILIIFTSLNIFLSGYTKGLIKYKDDKDGFTSSQLSLTMCITFFFFLIYIINTDFWTKIFDLSPILMIVMFIELITFPAYEFWMAKERFDYKYKKVVVISIIMNLLSILISIIAILNTNYKVEARAFSDVFAKLIFALPLLIILLINGKKIFNKEYWIYALKFNLPLLPHYLSNYVLNQSDRIMIGKMVGNSQAAYYSVAYTIAMVIMILITSINNSLVPYIYKSIDEGKEKLIKNKMNPLIILVSILCVCVMIFAPEIIRIFAGKSYMEAIYVIPPVAASVYFIFIYSLFSNIEYFYQKTGYIAIATTICALLNLILNYFGIKLFGYYAAGYTTLICYILLAVFHYIFYKKTIKENLKNIKQIYNTKLILIVSILTLILMLIITLTYKLFLIRYSLFIIVILLLIIKKNKVKEIFELLTKKA